MERLAFTSVNHKGKYMYMKLTLDQQHKLMSHVAQLDYSKIYHAMGREEYRKMDQAYWNWVGGEAILVEEEDPTFVMTPDGRVHASKWIQGYLKDTPKNLDMFVTKYLIKHGMESILEDACIDTCTGKRSVIAPIN